MSLVGLPQFMLRQNIRTAGRTGNAGVALRCNGQPDRGAAENHAVIPDL